MLSLFLKKHAFSHEPMLHNVTNKHGGIKMTSTCNQFYSSADIKIPMSQFCCDVFYSEVDSEQYVKNIGGLGKYHHMNVHINHVIPSKRRIIDDLYLPFFNKMKYDVFNEYGDVIYNCVINMDHAEYKKINSHYQTVYDEFDKLVENGKKNTLLYIQGNNEENNNETNEYHNNTHTCILNQCVGDFIFDVLKYIYTNHIKNIKIYDTNYLKHCISIKYYYPDIYVSYYITENFPLESHIYLNFVDEILFTKSFGIDENIFDDIIFIHKPKMTYNGED